VKLRELGSLPAAEVEAVAGYRKKEVIRELASVNEGLSKLGGVNKKAAEQFAAFQAERESLHKRAADTATSDASIRTLISSLDAQKEEALMRTFRGVAKHFKEVSGTRSGVGCARLHDVAARSRVLFVMRVMACRCFLSWCRRAAGL